MKKVILFWIIILWSMGLTYAADDDLWWIFDIFNDTEISNTDTSLPQITDTSNTDNSPSQITDTSPSQITDTSNTDTNITENHASAADNSNLWNSTLDNTVYNLIWYVKWQDVYIYYVPWNGVKNVKISYSYDNINYINLITFSAVNKYYHFPVDFSKKQIYIKVLPITDSNVGVMKEWVQTIPYITISLFDKKVAKSKIWYAKTWPESWILFIIFVFIYLVYRYKKI